MTQTLDSEAAEVVVLSTPGRLSRCVRSLRRRRGWQQADLAAAVGRSQQWVSAVEGGRSDPSLGDVITALSQLGASIMVQPATPPDGATQRYTAVSAHDLGTLIRQTRQSAGLTQQALAHQVGSTRQWVIRLEQGQPTVAMARVLDVLSELGLEMVAQHDLPPAAPRRPRNTAERRIADLMKAT